MKPPLARSLLPILAAAAAGLAGALWMVGLVKPLPQRTLATLLGTTAGIGLTAIAGAAAARRAPRGRRWAAGLAGAGAVWASGIFTTAVLHVPSGPVPVRRSTTAPAASPDRLRLVDFNVLHGYPEFDRQEERRERLLAALEALDADVLVLQEVWSVTPYGHLGHWLAERLGMDLAYARANGSRRFLGFEEGAAVLSRYPIVSAKRQVLRPKEPPWESRIALVVELDLGGGERLTVVGVHLARDEPRVRLGQAEDLLGHLPADGPLVVAGDFNAGSGSPVVETLVERGLVDLVSGGIDHVLLRPDAGWTPAGAGWALIEEGLQEQLGDGVAVSDHPGIRVDLRRVEKKISSAMSHPGPPGHHVY